MLIKILGGIDVITAIALMLNSTNIFPSLILIIFGIILIAKSFFGFLKDFGSWIDLICGIILIISTFLTIPLVILIILGVIIAQKGLASFL